MVSFCLLRFLNLVLYFPLYFVASILKISAGLPGLLFSLDTALSSASKTGFKDLVFVTSLH
jgi:hypothetical protein